MKYSKKIMLMLMVGVMSVTSIAPVFADNVETDISENDFFVEGGSIEMPELSFSDLKSGKWYTDIMIDLAEKRVLKGHNDQIRPNDQITRAEYAQILHNVRRQKGDAKMESTDIKKDAWYHDAMQAAITFDIMKGDGKGKYRPNDPLTREEVFVMTVRAFNIGQGKLANDGNVEELEDLVKNYKDHEKLSSWARKDANALIHAGYLKGNELKNLEPKKNITRAELGSLISEIKEIKEIHQRVKIVEYNEDKKPTDEKKPENNTPKDKPTSVPTDKPNDNRKKKWVEEVGHWEDHYEKMEVKPEEIIFEEAIYDEDGNMIKDEYFEVVKPAVYEDVYRGSTWIIDKPGYWKYLD